MPESPKITTYIISHTHWDREWYVPFQIFRFRLVEMMDHLIDVLERNPDFPYFNLDCQTIVIEDYLEIKPQNRERLAKLIQQNRIGIGPWYLLASPWLQTGEGFIRNLLRGCQIVKEFNTKPVNLGWIPDQFIQIAQAPQIFKGFGIDHAAFGRGMGNQYDEIPGLTCEFYWQGLDGTKILTFNMFAGYGLNAHLGKDPSQALNIMALNAGEINQIPWATNLRLSFHGSDHTGPEESIVEAIQIWNEEPELFEEYGRLKLSSWDEFLTDFKALNPQLKTVIGEISGRRYQISLHGVFSSMIPIKQRAFAIHDLLERWSEPFAVIANSVGAPNQYGFIRESWRWVLQNQPHDSSWTSSADQVAREMITRYDWAEQIADDVYRRSAQWILQHLQPSTDPTEIRIIVFNPHPWMRSGIIHARYSQKGNYSNFVLIDDKDTEITARIEPANSGDEDRYRRRVYVGSHGSLGQKFYQISFSADNIPPCGYKTYRIQKRDPSKDLFEPPEAGKLDGNDFYIENDRVRVVIEENGAISITLKNGEKEYAWKNIHLLGSISDVGDGWEFAPISGDKELILQPFDIHSQLMEATEHVGTLKITFCVKIPEGVNSDKTARSTSLIVIPMTLLLTLQKGDDPVIYGKLSMKNMARNHRLRLLLPTQLKAEEIAVNGHFGVIYRKIKGPDGSKWRFPPEPRMPHQKFVSIWDQNQSRGFGLFTKGIPEYECIPQEDGTVSLALTLLRSVTEWGHHLNVTPRMQIPDAALYGKELCWEYALVPQSGPWDDDNVPLYKLAENFYTPLRWEEDYDTYRYKPEKSTCNLPLTQSFLEIVQPNILLSSIKPRENTDGSEMVIRVYNIKNQHSPVEIRVHFAFKSIQFCDLRENPLNPQPSFQINLNCIVFELGPNKIASLLINR